MVSPRVHGPGPGPPAPPDVPGEDVVFQPVALRRGDSRQAGFQIAEHVLIGIAPVHRVHGGGDKGEDGLLENIGHVGLKDRNVVLGKNTLDVLPVPVHRPGGQGNVPVAQIALPDKPANLSRRPADLLSGGGAAPHKHTAVPFPFVGGQRPGKEVLFQPVQGLGPDPRPDRKGLLSHRAARLGGQPFQPGHGLLSRGEDSLLPFPVPAGEGHGDRVGLTQDLLQHQPLLGGEVGEAVQVDVLVLEEGVALEFVGQTGEPVPGVQAAPGGHGLVGPEDQPQVPELFPVQALGLLPHLGQLGPGDAAAFQLVHGGDKAGQEFRLPGGHGVHRQAAADRFQGSVHDQQTAALVQHRLGAAPGQGEHPVFQPGEGEDLSVPPRLVAVFPAEPLFCLEGGLLRHQQKLAADLSLLSHAAQDSPRLAAAGPAGDDMQHSLSSFVFLQHRPAASGGRPAEINCLNYRESLEPRTLIILSFTRSFTY